MPNLIFVDSNHDYIFFTETNDGKIQRCNLDGSNMTTVVTRAANVQDLTVDGEKQDLFWTEYDTGLIRRCDFNGNNISTAFFKWECIIGFRC
jgi:streptogramin lyase